MQDGGGGVVGKTEKQGRRWTLSKLQSRYGLQKGHYWKKVNVFCVPSPPSLPHGSEREGAYGIRCLRGGSEGAVSKENQL